jgi:S-adenosylmethionine hydrolase
MPRLPIVTLTTDFGLTDSYVAEMKGVLLGRCPEVRIVDVTHGVPPQDVLAGGFAVERVLRAFPPGTVHVAVVDPGVGSDRRILRVELHGQCVLCPDNGLITWAWRRLGGGAAYELTWRPPQTSATFHGRDIFAPAAAMLAAEESSAPRLCGPPVEPFLLPVTPATHRPSEAEVIHIDHFGNVTTNVPAEAIAPTPPKVIRLAHRSLGPVRRTYADVAEGEALALIGSSGLLEIAVRNGNAAHTLGLRVGDRLTIEY